MRPVKRSLPLQTSPFPKTPLPASCTGGNRAPPIDTSSLRSVPRYVTFVLATSSLTSVVLFAAPAILTSRVDLCRRPGGCYSLERDLMESIDSSVHPCDDLYRHVCHGWNKRENETVPFEKYERRFKTMFIWNLLKRNIPRRPKTALDKATSMLLQCVREGTQSSSKGGSALREFLLDVGLSWPQESAASRQQVLELLVKLSLELGMPTLWKFIIGRHPSRPTENTLYMALDSRFYGWSKDVQQLERRGTLHRYLRRAAEMVGGIGKSYSAMIDDVLKTHQQFLKVLQGKRSRYRIPQYMNLSDYDLRLAINGHLPDDSQLWIDDTVVVLQPGLFSAIDEEHLRGDAARRRFKLYLGAYLVWAISPVLASHLDRAMHADMGHLQTPLIHKTHHCLASISHLMPLVSWKVQYDYVISKQRAWHMLKQLTRSATEHIGVYSPELAARVTEATSRLTINAMNMTVAWSSLDQIYDYIPVYAGNGSYFDHYRRAAQATVRFWKKSLRRPQLNFYHLPDISTEAVYRILVMREVAISCAFFVPPLMMPDHPLAVSLATAGVQMASKIQVLLHIVLLFNDQFMMDINAELRPLIPFIKQLMTLRKYLNTAGRALAGLESLTATDIADMTHDGLVTLTASRVIESQCAATAEDGRHPASSAFREMPPGKVFFLVACFMECGGVGRSRLLKKAHCNAILPTMPLFKTSFQCTPKNRLATNYSWPVVASGGVTADNCSVSA